MKGGVASRSLARARKEFNQIMKRRDVFHHLSIVWAERLPTEDRKCGIPLVKRFDA